MIDSASQARRYAVIDGNSLLYRAFFAIKGSLSAPDGRPTNAVYGFFTMFVKMLEKLQPHGVVVAFDKGRPQARLDLLPEYKAQRASMPEELRAQFPLVHELLEALNVPYVVLPGWEGDDILGTLAKQGEAKGYEMYLVTGDKDAYQLATDQTSIVITAKGMSEITVLDPAGVREKLGVEPELVPDFKALVGDSSDNIPGVPKIGQKTAPQLLNKYGSLERLLEHAGEVRGKVGENLVAFADQARIAREVATISCEAPVELELENVSFPDFDPAQVVSVFNSLGINRLKNQFVEIAKAAGLEVAEVAQATGEGEALARAMSERPFVTDEAALTLIDKIIEQQLPCAVHVTVKIDEQDLLGILDREFDLYVATQDKSAHLTGEKVVMSALKTLVTKASADHQVIMHDVKASLKQLMPPDLNQPAEIAVPEVALSSLCDAQLIAYLLDSSQKDYELTTLAGSFGILDPAQETSDKELSPELFVSVLYMIREPLLARFVRDDEMAKVYYDIERPLILSLLELERQGMSIDVGELKRLAQKMQSEISEITQEIYQIAGEKFNINSQRDLGEILFEKMGLPPQKKTKRGYSTDATVLEALRPLSPIIDLISRYRELSKLKSTYVDALPPLVAPDGRIHTTFNQTVTATGRLSSSSPNLQNIPVRTEYGKLIRKAFAIKDPNRVFMSADYSQIELRLLAHLSQDKGLIEAFNHGEDFHAETASRVFHVPVDEVTPQMRSRAKAVNFGIVYGQQAFGLSSSLGISNSEAQEMIDAYYAAYPDVRRYLDDVVAFAEKQGWVATLFGRKRHINEIKQRAPKLRDFGKRTAMNHPMQGSAADIIKIAMNRVADRLRKEGLDAMMVVQVHDELDFEVACDQAEMLAAIVTEEMQNAAELLVKLEADVSFGSSWAEAK